MTRENLLAAIWDSKMDLTEAGKSLYGGNQPDGFTLALLRQVIARLTEVVGE